MHFFLNNLGFGGRDRIMGVPLEWILSYTYLKQKLGKRPKIEVLLYFIL